MNVADVVGTCCKCFRNLAGKWCPVKIKARNHLHHNQMFAKGILSNASLIVAEIVNVSAYASLSSFEKSASPGT